MKTGHLGAEANRDISQQFIRENSIDKGKNLDYKLPPHPFTGNHFVNPDYIVRR